MNHTKKYLDRLSQNAAEAGAEDIGIYITRLKMALDDINDITDTMDTRSDVSDSICADLYDLADHARDLHKQAEGWAEAMDDGKAYEADFRRDCDGVV